MNKKNLIKQNKDQLVTGSMSMRGAGLADWFGVSPVAVFRRHCWPFLSASPGAIVGTISPFVRWLQAPFSGAIFWLQASFPHRLQRSFRRASDTRLEASIKEKYRITALVSRLSLSLI